MNYAWRKVQVEFWTSKHAKQLLQEGEMETSEFSVQTVILFQKQYNL